MTWHHFDPPWKTEKHHNPDGMIALCLNHHGRANGEEYSREQLRKWKRNPVKPELLKTQFGWMFSRSLIRLGGGGFADSWCDLRIEDLSVFQAKRTSAGHLAFSFQLKNKDDELIAYMEDNMFGLFPERVHDFSATASGQRIKIWSDERKVGFEFRFSRISLEELEKIIVKDQPRSGGIPRPIDDLEDFYRQLLNLEKADDLVPLCRQRQDFAGVFLRWYASQCLDQDGTVPFLDLISARFWHKGKCIEMRDGKLMFGGMSLRFCVGHRFDEKGFG